MRRTVTILSGTGTKGMEREHAFDIEQILSRIAAGDRQAFAGIVERFQRPLYGFLGRMGLGQSQADELAQETFLRAWRGLGTYQPGKAAFSTWLFAIARHLALDELARQARRPEQATGDALPEVASDEPQPPARLALARQRQRVHDALGLLPAADRSALALFHIEELGLAEVARIENCTEGALKVRLHRARLRLRALLENDDV
jgi:RNA polymerase sigma-70 factor (ECF subfamily)